MRDLPRCSRRRARSSAIFIVTEATAEDGGGFFLDCPRALAPTLVEKLNFYKLRAKVAIEDLSDCARRDGVLGRERTKRRRPELCRSAAAGARHAQDPAAATLRPKPRPISAPGLPASKPIMHTASRSACRAAARISPISTPSRTKPTWTSSAASISTKAAMSARRWCRASSTAPTRAAAWCR